MSESEKIERLTVAFDRLCDLLARKDTELNGNWGYPAYETELTLIRQYAAGQLG